MSVQSLVVGSIFVAIPFYWGVKKIPERNFSLKGYPVKAALYFMLVGALSHVSAKFFRWTPLQRILITGFFSAMFISLFITLRKSYLFATKARWILQYLLLFASHTVAFSVLYFLGD